MTSTAASTAAGSEDELETGYRRATPEADNLLLDYARAEADAFAAIGEAGGGRTARVEALGLRLSDLGVASPFGNTAHLTRPIGSDETAALAGALRDFFDAVPGGPYLIFSPWPVGDLRPHGFHLAGHPPLMVRPPGVATSAPTGLRIEAVTTAADLAVYEQTLVEAYPAPEMQPWTAGALLDPAVLGSRWRFFVGYEGDRCVATAAAWPTGSVSLVEQVSVRDECRGKGYGRVITAAATTVDPAVPAMLVASDLGRGVYAQLGYLPLLRYTLAVGLRG